MGLLQDDGRLLVQVGKAMIFGEKDLPILPMT